MVIGPSFGFFFVYLFWRKIWFSHKIGLPKHIYMQISGLNADDKFESNPNNARLFGSKRKIQTRYEFKNLRSRSCYHASSKAVKTFCWKITLSERPATVQMQKSNSGAELFSRLIAT